MRSPYAWSCTPDRNALSTYDFNANSNGATVLKSQISLVFYRPHFYAQRPSGISNEDLSFNTTRRILAKNYTLTDIAQAAKLLIH
jgi:hypothetical protein